MPTDSVRTHGVLRAAVNPSMEAAGKTSLFFTPRNTPCARTLAEAAIRTGSFRGRQPPCRYMRRLGQPKICLVMTPAPSVCVLVVTQCVQGVPDVVGTIGYDFHVGSR